MLSLCLFLMMNADGTDNHNITPDYFPAEFLCHTPVFSIDDSKIFFIGEWWEWSSIASLTCPKQSTICL